MKKLMILAVAAPLFAVYAAADAPAPGTPPVERPGLATIENDSIGSYRAVNPFVDKKVLRTREGASGFYAPLPEPCDEGYQPIIQCCPDSVPEPCDEGYQPIIQCCSDSVPEPASANAPHQP